ncbi:MAG: NADH:flavin oxidoreductase/NADH oxidase [Alphaproteobacteria bacterium]|nr:NADH:flavin oxidoreductase/NADH oxidase [Alphaproteobacteria bacterium]
MTSRLFSPFALGPVELANRIVVAPMCQYSADDGCANDWHLQHWMQYAYSGAGLFMVEATAVERHGRITHGCLGLYSDANEAAARRTLDVARRVAVKTRFGIQIGHAGRKASAQRPWEGGKALTGDADPWITMAPSSIPFDQGWPAPRPLERADLKRIRDSFVKTAERAVRAGFEVIELHGAHGYLMHSFLSPIANRRDDEYGGSLENRMRFPLEVATAVRAVVPKHVALGMRLSATDWAAEGLTIEDSVEVSRRLKALGYDYVCASSGGVTPSIKVPVAPGYQVPLAERIRRDAGIATRAVGLIVDARQAEQIVASGQADMVAMARAFLDDPRWVWHAAERLGAPVAWPPQYDRLKPTMWPGAKLARPDGVKAAAD